MSVCSLPPILLQEEAGPEAANVLNIYPESIPDWMDGWLDHRCGYLVGKNYPHHYRTHLIYTALTIVIVTALVAYQPGRLLPVSALGGAALVLAADIALRLIPTETELKLGVVTALVGAPFFLYLVHKLRREAV